MRRTLFVCKGVMNFVTTRYTVKNPKVKSLLTVVLVSDMHNAGAGDGNRKLLEAVRREVPDLIIAAGDMVVGHPAVPLTNGLAFLKALPEIAPTFYANGNHERSLKMMEKRGERAYSELIGGMEESGVVILNNEAADISLGGTDIRLYGLDLPLRLYKKFRKPHIFPEHLRRNLGEPSGRRLNLLIAHNPEFTDAYFAWGAELVFSGHYHGGLLRSPFSGRALLSPYGYILPKYGVGLYEHGGQYAVISAGLGDHSIPVRIFDPHELVVVNLIPS